MASVKVILRTTKINETGTAPLYLRITKDRKSKFISLKLRVKPSEWKDGRVTKAHPNSARYNAYIKQKEAEAENIAIELETKSKTINSYKIKEKLIGKATSNFFEYADKYVNNLEKHGTVSTYKRAKSIIGKLKIYMDSRPLFFDDITVGFLKDLEQYLATELNNRTNTIHTNIKLIRKLINDAINEGIIDQENNPFLRYKIKSEKTERNYLTEEELKRIEEIELQPSTNIYHHRNAYIFACYVGGIRISDLLQLKWRDFDGEKLNIKIQKTGSILSIKIPEKGLEILNIYAKGLLSKSIEDQSGNYIFPILKLDSGNITPKILHNAISSATAYINKDLKLIAQQAKIKKSISFHTSRHTWATRALRKGMRIEYVSKLMGHAAIKETQIYAKIVNEELDKAMDVFNK
jgi:integrase/recombinase XerD